MVVVEARPARFEQLGDFAVAAGGAQVAPAVEDMHFGRLARAIMLDHAERAAVRPLGAFQAGERGGDACMVHMDVFLAGADAGATPDLVAKACALMLHVESERLQAKPMLVRCAAKRLHCSRARAPQP